MPLFQPSICAKIIIFAQFFINSVNIRVFFRLNLLMVSVVVIVLMAGFGTRVKQKRTPKVVRSFGVRVDEKCCNVSPKESEVAGGAFSLAEAPRGYCTCMISKISVLPSIAIDFAPSAMLN